MTVQELIDALDKIHDKKIEVAFMCNRCHQMSEVEDMKELRFLVNNATPTTD